MIYGYSGTNLITAPAASIRLLDGIYGRDGKPFGKTAIYNLLQNERYIGVYRHKTDGVFLNTFAPIVPKNLFDIVRRICSENKSGGGIIEDPYLLRGKIYCGYCGQKMRGDAGTSKSGKVFKYYACLGRKQLKNKCKKQTLRKEDLEKLVVDVTIKALDNPENVAVLVDKIFEINEERSQSNSTLAILYSEQQEIQKSIDNLMRAIEQGIVTNSTMMRMNELESRLDEIKAKAHAEESKHRLKMSRSEVIKFINKAIREEPAHMIRLLVKRITVYDDKIEIQYNTTERIRPDEDTHQAFCFYTETAHYENHGWWFTVKGGGEFDLEINLLI